jgi:hypothetical protein
MKPNTTERSIKELEAAQKYLFKEEVPVIGRSPIFQCVIDQMEMPLLPRLQSNVEEREKLKKEGIVRFLIKSAHKKCNVIVKVFRNAIAQEKQKPFYSFLYTLETDERENYELYKNN